MEQFKKFDLMPYELRKDITDSLLLDSGKVILKAETSDGYKIDIMVIGDVRLLWKGEVYKSACQFPDELTETIRKGDLGNADLEIGESNWYEMSVCYPNGELAVSDFIDLDLNTITEEELKSAVMEWIDDIRTW